MTLASILGDAIIGLWKSQKAVWIRSNVTSNPGEDDKSKNPATFQGHCLPIVVSKMMIKELFCKNVRLRFCISVIQSRLGAQIDKNIRHDDKELANSHFFGSGDQLH